MFYFRARFKVLKLNLKWTNSKKMRWFWKATKMVIFAEAIERQNGLFLGEISKCQKHNSCESRDNLEMFYAKSGLRNHLIFEK